MVFTLTNETLMHNETDLAIDVDIKLINHMPNSDIDSDRRTTRQAIGHMRFGRAEDRQREVITNLRVSERACLPTLHTQHNTIQYQTHGNTHTPTRPKVVRKVK